jgi:hypothetical protein
MMAWGVDGGVCETLPIRLAPELVELGAVGDPEHAPASNAIAAVTARAARGENISPL